MTDPTMPRDEAEIVRLAPREPTAEMIEAVRNCAPPEALREIWRTMFDAAPSAARPDPSVIRAFHPELMPLWEAARREGIEEAAKAALVALPKSHWSCSDDESGTSLTLARQRRFTESLIRALIQEPSHDK